MPLKVNNSWLAARTIPPVCVPLRLIRNRRSHDTSSMSSPKDANRRRMHSSTVQTVGYFSLASYNSPSWSFDDCAALAPNTENGTFFEAAIDLTDLGYPTPASISRPTYCSKEPVGSVFLRSFPLMLFAEQAYDPNVSTHLTITPVPMPQSILLMRTAFLSMVAFTIRAGR